MNYREKYNEWMNNPLISEKIKSELTLIKDNENEIKERFYKDLEFGTGGLRGIVGAGTNRMNQYTVGIASQGLASYINQNVPGDKKVAIAYDSRNKSDEFAQLSAQILAANGIKVYIFPALRSTPELSFAVRHLKCTAGIVITASHNPSEYNGYKVYWDYGCQLLPKRADELIEVIRKHSFSDIKMIPFNEGMENGLINEIDRNVDDLFIQKVKTSSITDDVNKDIKIVYTPLNGTGNIPVRRVLTEKGYKNLFIVGQQEKPDPNFTTVGYPNPEDPAAFELSLKLADEKDADIIIATDPDCDRLGVAVKNKNNQFEILSGNQVGALLMNYILSQKTEKNMMPENPYVIKTVVTSELGRVIAESYGAECLETLTGFKFIGEVMEKHEKNGDKNYVFGYEESIGYLIGKYVRDKDGVTAALLTCEMAGFYNKRGKALTEVLEQIYSKYGYYVDRTTSIKMEGIEGVEKIKEIMKNFRENPLVSAGNIKISRFSDYKKLVSKDYIKNTEKKIDNYQSDVLKYYLEDGSWFVIRPSGTEPKIKIYFCISDEKPEKAEIKYEKISGEIFGIINNI